MQTSGNTTPANYTLPEAPLIVGIDSLQLSVYGQMRRSTLDRVITSSSDVLLNGMRFKLKTGDRGVYRATLDNKLMSVMLDNKLPSFSSPSVYLQMKPCFIWGEGLIPAYERVRELMNSLFEGNYEGEKVSRVDPFADFDWPLGFKSEDVHKFVSRARFKHTFLQGDRLSGFTVGSGKLMARLYDKTLEAPRSEKQWLYELWGVDRKSTVWRTEFQIRRERLRGFGIESFSDLLSRVQPMWRYLSDEWLTMRDGTDKNVTRRPITPFWKLVQGVCFDLSEDSPTVAIPVAVNTGRPRECLIKQIAGLVRGFARRNGERNPGVLLDCLLPDIRREIAYKAKRNGFLI